MEKLFCHVTQTGKDAQGKVFSVMVIRVKDLEEKEGAKLRNTVPARDSRHIRPQELHAQYSFDRLSEGSRNNIFLVHSKGSGRLHRQIIAEAVAAAVEVTRGFHEYEASVFVDGLSKVECQRMEKLLGRLGVHIDQVWGVRRESHAMLRLIDAFASHLRGKINKQFSLNKLPFNVVKTTPATKEG